MQRSWRWFRKCKDPSLFTPDILIFVVKRAVSLLGYIVWRTVELGMPDCQCSATGVPDAALLGFFAVSRVEGLGGLPQGVVAI